MKKVLFLMLMIWVLGCSDDKKDSVSNGTDSTATTDTTDSVSSSGGSDSNSDIGSDSISDMTSDNGKDTDTDTDTNNDCARIGWGVELKPINMLVLLDRSKSMKDGQMTDAATSTVQSYAAVVQNAIEYIVQQNSEASSINFALNVFPSATECTGAYGELETQDILVQCQPASQYISTSPDTAEAPLVEFGREGEELMVSSETSTLIQTALTGIGQCGGTPISQSLEWALHYLQAEQMPPGDTYVLLATDGAPNCNPNHKLDNCLPTDGSAVGKLPQQCLDDMSSYQAAINLRKAGYKVFVIGVGSDAVTDSAMFQEVMDGLAYFGSEQTPVIPVPTHTEPYYFAAEDPAALDAALENITNEVIDCEYQVDWLSVPDTFEDANVDKNCSDINLFGENSLTSAEVPIGYAENCATIAEGDLGWYWVETPNVPFAQIEALGKTYSSCATVKLCPTACEKMKSTGGVREWSKVTAQFGCESVVLTVVE